MVKSKRLLNHKNHIPNHRLHRRSIQQINHT